MVRKKPSPSNQSLEDEGNSEGIDSDSSLELNSRRNTYRKKPQRRCSLGKNRNNYPLETTERGIGKKPQENTSENNKRRPSIVKIFRRIGRRAKNIYLVDDKIEDRKELIALELKNNLYISDMVQNVNTLDKMYLLDSCKAERILKYDKHPETVEINCEGDGFKELNVWKLQRAFEASTLSNEEETDVWNLPREPKESPSSVTVIDKATNKDEVGVWNYRCNMDDFQSSSPDTVKTSDRYRASNQQCETEDKHSSVTDNDQTPDRGVDWNQPCETDIFYSPLTDISEALSRDDSSNESDEIADFFSSITDGAQTPDVDWSRLCETDNLYSSVTDISQASDRGDTTNQPYRTGDIYSLMTDKAQRSVKDVSFKPYDVDALNPSITNVDKHLVDLKYLVWI